MANYEIVELIAEARRLIDNRNARSAWDKGVKEYAVELLRDLADLGASVYEIRTDTKKLLLNGARDWNEYSEGGSALIYDYEIAMRLCTPSELRRNRSGDRAPNACETWLDVQARALSSAARRVCGAITDAAYNLDRAAMK